jgi:site-specific DNA-cytosine methylase
MIGKRIFDDPRNRLVGDFVRIVCELDADYFVFENVKGLTVGEHRKFWNNSSRPLRRKDTPCGCLGLS